MSKEQAAQNAWKAIKERAASDRSANLTIRNGALSSTGIVGAVTFGIINYKGDIFLQPEANLVAGTIALCAVMALQIRHSRRELVFQNILEKSYESITSIENGNSNVEVPLEYKDMVENEKKRIGIIKALFNADSIINSLTVFGVLSLVIATLKPVSEKPDPAKPTVGQHEASLTNSLKKAVPTLKR